MAEVRIESGCVSINQPQRSRSQQDWLRMQLSAALYLHSVNAGEGAGEDPGPLDGHRVRAWGALALGTYPKLSRTLAECFLAALDDLARRFAKSGLFQSSRYISDRRSTSPRIRTRAGNDGLI
jgi:hypothetical protein